MRCDVITLCLNVVRYVVTVAGSVRTEVTSFMGAEYPEALRVPLSLGTSSSGAAVTRTVPGLSRLDCPAVVDASNWGNQDTDADYAFNIQVQGKTITATRSDGKGWNLALKVMCRVRPGSAARYHVCYVKDAATSLVAVVTEGVDSCEKGLVTWSEDAMMWLANPLIDFAVRNPATSQVYDAASVVVAPVLSSNPGMDIVLKQRTTAQAKATACVDRDFLGVRTSSGSGITYVSLATH